VSTDVEVRRLPAPATSDSVPHGRRDLPSLTGLRFVAALMVFAFHTSGYGVTTTGWWRLPQFGFVGVAFFFVLSGVVLTWSSRPGTPARTFWRRRFARVYPAHAVTAVIAIAAYLWFMPPHKALWAGVLALLLLQAWPPVPAVNSAANGVSWSLSCEAFFYALFPWIAPALARRSRARRRVFVGAVLAGCAAMAIVGSLAWGGRYDVPLYENPLVRAGEFVLGVALGLALREGWVPMVRRRTAWSAAAAAAGAALLLGWARGWPVPRGIADVLAVGPLALVLVAYAGRDLRGRESWMGRRAMVYLGQLSFAFYLVHQLVMDTMLKRVAPLTDGSVAGALWRTALALALSLAGAAALHHLVELPGQRWLTRRGRRPATVLPMPYPDREQMSPAAVATR
jgi:peptidoglycan/LPS O-acetylase OafA/YrhL